MTINSAVAAPVSRKDLRASALRLRARLGLEKKLYFPVIQFLEWVLPIMDHAFVLEVLSKATMGNCHGQACPEKHTIFIREDVYYGAIANNGRDRFTIAHEIGHYSIHKPGHVRYARMESGVRVAAYQNPEWQANTFAAELLMPYDLIRGMSIDAIARECAVSHQAATIQVAHTRK